MSIGRRKETEGSRQVSYSSMFTMLLVDLGPKGIGTVLRDDLCHVL